MYKVSHFSAIQNGMPTAIPLFTRADEVFEKVASATLLPEVVRYIDTLRPRQDAQYVLNNALGAGEWWGSNSNGDHFEEAGLIHKPEDWTHNPLLDRIKAKNCSYAFPTFYNAGIFPHHRNQDASKSLGEIELAAWNDVMKRVELVMRFDKDKCLAHGGVAAWDKLADGQFPDTSMGAKVKYDLCSVCTDLKLYDEAIATFDPKRHSNPGDAALEFHKKLLARGGDGIRGLAPTRKTYCDHARKQMNHILPNGVKVWVRNPYPKFFDHSVVFIGADKTSKMMMKLAGGSKMYWFLGPSGEVAEKLGFVNEEDLEVKVASAYPVKRAEMTKNVPAHFVNKAVPSLTANEHSLPTSLLDRLGKDLPSGLSTTAGMGVVLRPQEFQRMMLVSMGGKEVADEMDKKDICFGSSTNTTSMGLSPDLFSVVMSQLLLPWMLGRCLLAPMIESRALIACGTSRSKTARLTSSLPGKQLDKIASAYNGYRAELLDMMAYIPQLLSQSTKEGNLSKLASADVEALFSPLSVGYAKLAFLDELGAPSDIPGVSSGV